MSEAQMRGRVVKGLRELNAIAVENPVLPGTPDVNYIEGWIELKWLRSWPQRDGIVRIPHFTPQQRVWHYRRRKAGGNSWFLLQCSREWILIDGAIAAFVVNNATREQLIEVTEFDGRYWPNSVDWDELADHVRKSQKPWNFTPNQIEAMRR